ncbi:MAG: DUF4384 domain-containing protein [Pseudomonadota bacterium]
MTIIQRLMWVLALGGVMLISGSPAEARKLSPEQVQALKLMSGIKNKNPGFKIRLWTEGEKLSYKVGEQIKFNFSAEEDCYVYIIDIRGSSGDWAVLFPNEFHKSNWVQKGQTITIPPEGAGFAIDVQGPAGSELIKAFASVEPMFEDLGSSVNNQIENKGGFAMIRKGFLVTKQIAEEAEKAPEKNWTETELNLEIVEGSK